MIPKSGTYPHGLTRARANLTLVVLSLTAFVLVTSEILPYGVIAMMAEGLGRSESQIGLIVSVHAAVVVAVSIVAAHTTKHLPRRLLLPAAIGVFILGTLVVATASSFPQLVVGRSITALGHATFWVVVTATAASLFPPEVRGKTIARLFVGSTVAGVMGMPAGTWLAHRTSWNLPFFVLAGFAAIMAVAVYALVPHYHPKDGGAARGSSPSLGRFVAILGIVFFTIVGWNTTLTFITPFFRDVTGFSERTIPAVLVTGGLAGLVGMLAAARVLDRHPRSTLAVGLVLVLSGWLGLAAAGSGKPSALAFYFLGGVGMSMALAAWTNRVMIVSPGNTDLGIAILTTTYNAGLAIGAFVGSRTVDAAGARILPMVSAGCVMVALAILSTEPGWQGRLGSRLRSRQVTGLN